MSIDFFGLLYGTGSGGRMEDGTDILYEKVFGVRG
jgi:hypothetical protein